jgi:hypothetical protein
MGVVCLACSALFDHLAASAFFSTLRPPRHSPVFPWGMLHVGPTTDAGQLMPPPSSPTPALSTHSPHPLPDPPSQYASHSADVHYYVPPDVVESLPSGYTPLDFVTDLDARMAAAAGATSPGTTTSTTSTPTTSTPTTSTPTPMKDAAAAFFEGPAPLLLVLGEPGLGKTVFTWMTAWGLLQAPAPTQGKRKGAPQGSPWLPLVIDLKEHTASALRGLLPTLLSTKFGLGPAAVASLAQGECLPGQATPTRLAVFCDGFDELKTEKGGAGTNVSWQELRNFHATLCGGAWDTGAVKVVVTSRESRLLGADEKVVFGPEYARLVLLPFSVLKVRVLCTMGDLCIPFFFHTLRAAHHS